MQTRSRSSASSPTHQDLSRLQPTRTGLDLASPSGEAEVQSETLAARELKASTASRHSSTITPVGSRVACKIGARRPWRRSRGSGGGGRCAWRICGRDAGNGQGRTTSRPISHLLLPFTGSLAMTIQVQAQLHYVLNGCSHLGADMAQRGRRNE